MAEESFSSLVSTIVEAGVGLSSSLAASAGLAGWATGEALGIVLGRRAEAARVLLLEELRRGTLPTDYVASGDEAVAVLYRYQRAAMEGTARLNLRLMAQVICGQIVKTNLIADEFLHHADILASLSRPEIVLLGTILRLDKQIDQTENRIAAMTRELQSTLVGQPMFPDQVTFEAYCNSVVRFGLLSEGIGGERAMFGPIPVLPSPILRDLAELIDIDAAIDSEAMESKRGL